jgi:cytoskeletal protein CcmA (bactofilin family)
MSGSTTTPILGLTKPQVGASRDTWGNMWNANADTLDAKVLPLAGGTVTGSLQVNGNMGVSGALTVAGNITTNNSVTAAYIHDTGNAQIDGALTVNSTLNVGSNAIVNGTLTAGAVSTGGALNVGSLTASGNVIAGGGSYAANDTGFGFFVGGAGRVYQFQPSWYWDWNASNGTLSYTTPPGGFWVMRTTDELCYNGFGPVGGVGAYYNASDERGKRDITATGVGLAQVLAIQPIRFVRDRKTAQEIGFSAQQLKPIIPEAVARIGIPLADGSGGVDSGSPTLGIAVEPIVAALVNAVKQLTARLEALEQAKREP